MSADASVDDARDIAGRPMPGEPAPPQPPQAPADPDAKHGSDGGPKSETGAERGVSAERNDVHDTSSHSAADSGARSESPPQDSLSDEPASEQSGSGFLRKRRNSSDKPEDTSREKRARSDADNATAPSGAESEFAHVADAEDKGRAEYPARDQAVWREEEHNLDLYIWDYLRCRGLWRAADAIQRECKLPANPTVPLRTPLGLLYEYWTVFWDVFTARSGRGTESAAMYNAFLEHRRAERIQELKRQNATNADARADAALGGDAAAQLSGALSAPGSSMLQDSASLLNDATSASAAALLPSAFGLPDALMALDTPGATLTPQMKSSAHTAATSPADKPQANADNATDAQRSAGCSQPPRDEPNAPPEQAQQDKRPGTPMQHAPSAHTTPMQPNAQPTSSQQQTGMPPMGQPQMPAWNVASLTPQQQQSLLVTAVLRQGLPIDEIKNLPQATRIALINSLLQSTGASAANGMANSQRGMMPNDPALQAQMLLQQQHLQNQMLMQSFKGATPPNSAQSNASFDRMQQQQLQQQMQQQQFALPSLGAKQGPASSARPDANAANEMQKAGLARGSVAQYGRTDQHASNSLQQPGYFGTPNAGVMPQQQQPQQQQPQQQQQAAQQLTAQQKQMFLIQYQTLQSAAKAEWMKAQSAPTPALAQQFLANSRQLQSRSQVMVNMLQGKMMMPPAVAEGHAQHANALLEQQQQQQQQQRGQSGAQPHLAGQQQAHAMHLQSLVQRGLAPPLALQQQHQHQHQHQRQQHQHQQPADQSKGFPQQGPSGQSPSPMDLYSNASRDMSPVMPPQMNASMAMQQQRRLQMQAAQAQAQNLSPRLNKASPLDSRAGQMLPNGATAAQASSRGSATAPSTPVMHPLGQGVNVYGAGAQAQAQRPASGSRMPSASGSIASSNGAAPMGPPMSSWGGGSDSPAQAQSAQRRPARKMSKVSGKTSEQAQDGAFGADDDSRPDASAGDGAEYDGRLRRSTSASQADATAKSRAAAQFSMPQPMLGMPLDDASHGLSPASGADFGNPSSLSAGGAGTDDLTSMFGVSDIFDFDFDGGQDTSGNASLVGQSDAGNSASGDKSMSNDAANAQ